MLLGELMIGEIRLRSKRLNKILSQHFRLGKRWGGNL